MTHATPSTTTIPTDGPLITLLRNSFPSTLPSPDASTSYTAADLFKSTYPSTTYTDPEKDAIAQWLTTSSHLSPSTEDAAKTTERLTSLNTHLATRTTLLGSKPSVADAAMYVAVAPEARKWGAEERTGERGYHHIMRWLDLVQNGEQLFGLKVHEEDKVAVDANDIRSAIKPIDAKAEKEKRRKEKEAAAAASPSTTGGGGATTLPVRGKKAAANETDSNPQQQQRPKREKQPKPPKPPAAPEKPLSPSLIDLRVGHILRATAHPNADSLYVSKIAVGDAAGAENTTTHTHSDGKEHVVRTVCSGLNGLVPLAEMQDRRVVAVCNLKPVTMRGVKSCAMVLAASPRGGEDSHGGLVELVAPPEGARAGERCWFEGWKEGKPDAVLNPKRKVWEVCQTGFTTTEGCEVAFEKGKVEALSGKEGVGDVGVLRTEGGPCCVRSLRGATVR